MANAGMLVTGAGNAGVFTRFFERDQFAVGGQRTRDPNATVPGQCADLQRFACANGRDQQVQGLAFVGLQTDMRKFIAIGFSLNPTQCCVFGREQVNHIAIEGRDFTLIPGLVGQNPVFLLWAVGTVFFIYEPVVGSTVGTRIRCGFSRYASTVRSSSSWYQSS